MIGNALKRLDDAIATTDWPVIRSATRELAATALTCVERAAADRMQWADDLDELRQARAAWVVTLAKSRLD